MKQKNPHMEYTPNFKAVYDKVIQNLKSRKKIEFRGVSKPQKRNLLEDMGIEVVG